MNKKNPSYQAFRKKQNESKIEYSLSKRLIIGNFTKYPFSKKM